MQKWVELHFPLGDLDRARVEETLELAGALSVSLHDGGDEPMLEPAPGETPIWSDTRVVGLWEEPVDHEALGKLLSEHLPGFAESGFEFRELADRNWQDEWLNDAKPRRFGRRTWIYPWEPPAAGGDEVHILLEPGLAFGTGDHATTGMCLTWLDKHLTPGGEVLDMGCGSGILAVAAARLGAAHVTAIDIDPQAIVATGNNAETNGCAERLTITPNGKVIEGKTYDTVLANILCNTLTDMAADLCACTRPGGDIVLTGLLAHQADEVITAYAPWATLAVTAQEEDWILVSGTRNS